jgi:hypothetical protein
MKTITVKNKDLKHDLSIFPNFSATGSIRGMKKLYYGANANVNKVRRLHLQGNRGNI